MTDLARLVSTHLFAGLLLTAATVVSGGCNTLTSTELEALACTTDDECPIGSSCVEGYCETSTSDALPTSSDTDMVADTGGGEGCADCGAAQICCIDTCVDLLTDGDNCGGCGIACQPSESCVAGACDCGDTGQCGANQLCCDDGCKLIGEDLSNCGACGVSCGLGEQCAEGSCTCAGPSGSKQRCAGAQVCCPTLGCRDLTDDPLTCGACDLPCRPGESCVDGTCDCDGATCGQNESCCGGECVPSDSPQCGCGSTTCQAGQSCCTDNTGAQVCVDLGSDDDNCATCGLSCGVGAACQGGSCNCEDGLADCDGSAGCETNITTDHLNCGACGVACGANETCCDGMCVDRTDDTGNCGACGTTCPSGANADAVCSTGTCAITCDSTDFADCDANPSSGCEANLQTSESHCGACGVACSASSTCCSGSCANTDTSVTNCGACGNACPTAANASRACVSGSCELNCTSTFDDCDGSAANGCEANLATSEAHCGACNAACIAGQTCCGSGCVNTTTSELHCGACGIACAAGQTCCGGTCVSTTSNPSHCGGCNVPCALSCIGGICQ